eukprot:6200840-Pleurochrysis_carterae.AAC.5
MLAPQTLLARRSVGHATHRAGRAPLPKGPHPQEDLDQWLPAEEPFLAKHRIARVRRSLDAGTPARTHARTQTDAHVNPHAHACVNARARKRSRTHVPVCLHTDARVRVHPCSSPRRCPPAHTFVHAR